MCCSMAYWKEDAGDWDFHSTFLVTWCIHWNSSLSILGLCMSYIACEGDLAQNLLPMDCQGSFG